LRRARKLSSSLIFGQIYAYLGDLGISNPQKIPIQIPSSPRKSVQIPEKGMKNQSLLQESGQKTQIGGEND
jgi:hypothetical protein